MKIAKVVSIFKKGSTFLPTNYRPISILSCFNKLFEKLICRRLVSFLESNHIFYDYQFGFRKLHSTTLALIEIYDSIRRLLMMGIMYSVYLLICPRRLIPLITKFFFTSYIIMEFVDMLITFLGPT